MITVTAECNMGIKVLPTNLLNDANRGYCAEYGRQARDLFQGESWDSVEPRLRQCWQHNHPHVAWEAARNRVEAEWWRYSSEE